MSSVADSSFTLDLTRDIRFRRMAMRDRPRPNGESRGGDKLAKDLELDFFLHLHTSAF